MKNVYVGKVREDSLQNRGWFVGHFVDAANPRFSEDVEIKWGIHKKGESRDGWSTNALATTMSLVIKGKIKMIFEDGEVVLKEGDYFISKPQTLHTWTIEEDTTIITVRWPSLPQDHTDIK